MSKSIVYPKIIIYSFVLGFIIMAIYGLIIARPVLYPLALAVLFASLLFPLSNFLEKRWKFHRILSIIITELLAITVLVGLTMLLANQFRNIIDDFSEIKTNAAEKAHILQLYIETNIGIKSSEQELWLGRFVSNIFESGNRWVQNIFNATTNTVSSIILMPIYIFFMLFYRDKFAEFLIRVAKSENKENTEKFIHAVSQVTENYMSGVAIVVSILMVVNSLALYMIGLDYAIFLGVVAALCNFIPYFGTILGYSFPLLFSLLTENSPEHVVGIIIVFIIVQFTENNILTPNIVGSNVKLNPFVIIISLIIGSIVWGVAGMLVVVPTIAVLKIYFERDEATKPYAYLLGVSASPRHAIHFSGVVRFVQKLFRKKRKK